MCSKYCTVRATCTVCTYVRMYGCTHVPCTYSLKLNKSNELNALLADLRDRVNLDYYLRQKISQDELAVRILELRTNGALSLQKTLENFL